MTLHPIPAFSDNYIWVLHHAGQAWAVDPGDAAPVLGYLQQHQLQLQGILLTHHHADHVGGVQELRKATNATVYGPAFETLPEPVQRLGGSDSVTLLGHHFDVLDVPGHTSGHIAYYCADWDDAPLLFCGDTLFSGGCGRIFEGTPAQMLASLDALAALPDATRVCCTHEYTLGNLRFALAVEPGNADLVAYEQACQQLRAADQPTLPSTLGLERRINPFLRSRLADVVASVQQQAPDTPASDEVAVFAALREWKNNFR